MPDNINFTYSDSTIVTKNLNRAYRYLYFTMLCTAIEEILCFQNSALAMVDDLYSYAFSQFIQMIRHSNCHLGKKIEFKGAVKNNCDKWIEVFYTLGIDRLDLRRCDSKGIVLYSYELSPIGYKSIITGLLTELERLESKESVLLR